MNTQTLDTILTWFFLLALFFVPIILFSLVKRFNSWKLRMFVYFLVGLVATFILMWMWAWWADKSTELVMAELGYNFDAIRDTERYGNIAPENLEKVEQLERSYMGVGWPVRAILSFVSLCLPYLVIVYSVGWVTQFPSRRFH